jgi:hypothetical protein
MSPRIRRVFWHKNQSLMRPFFDFETIDRPKIAGLIAAIIADIRVLNPA